MRHLEESRLRAEQLAAGRSGPISGLVEELIESAEAVKSQLDELQQGLEEARRRAEAAEVAGAEPAAAANGVGATAEAMPAAGDRPAARATAAPPGTGFYEALPEGAESLLSASVRLLATQMAILSRSRDEIALRLREEFGIDVPVGLEAPPERDEAYSS